jgi:multidrug resistance protein, MATE family
MFVNEQWREIVKVAAPVVISKLSFTLMGVVDTAMVGRLGPSEQAAVGIATTFMFTLYVFGLGIISVVNTLVAQYHGAGKKATCGLVLGHGLRIGTIIGAVTWLVLFYSKPLFSIAGLSDEVAVYGYDYLLFRITGLFSVFWFWNYNAFMEGIGDTRTPMWITLAGNLMNIVLDYALIFGFGPIPAMGVAGAGLATAIGNLFILVCFVIVTHRPGSRYRREFGIDRFLSTVQMPIIYRMLKTGFPMGLQFLMEVGAYLVFSVVVGWVGDIALAANQVAIRVMSISFMVAFGIGVAATTLVGRHQGEERADLALMAGRRSLLLMLGYSIACAILFLFAAAILADLFTPFREVADATVSLLYIAAVFQVFDGINMVGYGALRGAGDTRWPLWIVILIHWGIGVPLVYYLTIVAGFGVLGTWLGMCTMMVCQAALIYYRFESGRWKHIRLVDATI